MENEESMKDNAPSASPAAERRIRKSIMSKYPDFKAESEDEWNAKEDEYFGEVEDDLNAYRSSEAQLEEMIKANPDLAEVINDMVSSKMPFRVALARHYSQEDLMPKEGDDDFEAYGKEYSARLERAKRKEEQLKEIVANEATSLENIERFAKDNGLSDEEKNNLVDYINTFFNDMLFKKISPDMLSMFRNAITHDKDVESAREEGEIKGRNANIEAQIESENSSQSGDGIPASGKGAEVRERREKQPGEELFDFLGKRKRI